MIRASWMWRNSPSIAGSEVSEVVDELDKAGYYSILFPIKSTNADYLPRVISSMKPDQQIKYMIPIRPYLLSPQYLSMLSAGIEAVIPGRTIFNFINGHIGEDENLDGIIYSSIDFSDKTDRRRHLEDFIKTLDRIKMHEQPDFSEILVSGGSLETLEVTHRLGVGLATSYSSFMQNHYEFYSKFNFKNIYVQVCILLTDSQGDSRVTEALANNPSGVIYGSYSEISKKIQELESMGVTDLLISNAFDGGKEERRRIHSFVASFSSIQ
jgi:pyruvoyl-dependent arginine decarboxylase (PvlArgDC)